MNGFTFSLETQWVRKLQREPPAKLRGSIQTDSSVHTNFRFSRFIDPCLNQLISSFQSPVGSTQSCGNNNIKPHVNIVFIIWHDSQQFWQILGSLLTEGSNHLVPGVGEWGGHVLSFDCHIYSHLHSHCYI